MNVNCCLRAPFYRLTGVKWRLVHLCFRPSDRGNIGGRAMTFRGMPRLDDTFRTLQPAHRVANNRAMELIVRSAAVAPGSVQSGRPVSPRRYCLAALRATRWFEKCNGSAGSFLTASPSNAQAASVSPVRYAIRPRRCTVAAWRGSARNISLYAFSAAASSPE